MHCLENVYILEQMFLFCIIWGNTTHLNCPCQITLRSNYQRLSLPPLLTPTVDTTYCDDVLIACHETSQFILCNGGIRDVHRSITWELGSISAGSVDEVEISTVSATQCPAHGDIDSSTDIFIEVFTSREVDTREGWDRGGTWRNEWPILVSHEELSKKQISVLDVQMCTTYFHIKYAYYSAGLCTNTCAIAA